jgi:hypothetical protein
MLNSKIVEMTSEIRNRHTYDAKPETVHGYKAG